LRLRAGNFTKLAAALTSAGLVDDLKGAGPFTVFAPTDEAFAKLSATPTGDALANVLLYHVVSGIAGPLDLKDKGVLTTLSGSPGVGRDVEWREDRGRNDHEDERGRE
jgi:uncharacterized surface protein with fasciclin (FAS1) repeats